MEDGGNRYTDKNSKIAEGKEGVVNKGIVFLGDFVAFDSLTKRDVAIKIMRLAKYSEEEVLSMCLQAQLLSKCDSPQIIKLYDAFLQEDLFNLVFEYAPYGDLWMMMNRSGYLSEWAAANLIKQILTGINYLHTVKQIVHWYAIFDICSDIKLENVVLTKQKTIKLIDFGSAVELSGAARYLNTGEPRGTSIYLAPECWNGLYSPASDIWAIGVILSLMLFMVSPFNGRNKEEVREKALSALELKGKRDLPFLNKL